MWLDNYLVIAFVADIFLTYRTYPLPTFSYLLLESLCVPMPLASMRFLLCRARLLDVEDLWLCLSECLRRLVHFLFGVIFGYLFLDCVRRYSSIRPECGIR